MDIYKAFNSRIDLLKYEIYVKLSQASKSTKVMDKNLLEKLLEYEEAEEQRLIWLYSPLSLLAKNL